MVGIRSLRGWCRALPPLTLAGIAIGAGCGKVAVDGEQRVSNNAAGGEGGLGVVGASGEMHGSSSSSGGGGGLGADGGHENAGRGGDQDGGAGGASCKTIACEAQDGQTFECGDCVDNDGDGFIDAQDVDCIGPCDDSEQPWSGGFVSPSAPAE